MKTVYEIQCWLKNKQYALDLDFEKGRFYVDIYKDHVQNVISSGESASLEGALENALEELRRKDNGAESVRTEKAPNIKISFTPPANAKNVQLSQSAFNAVLKSLGSAPVMVPPSAIAVQHIVCPTCGHFPQSLIYGSTWMCGDYRCNRNWSSPQPVAGTAYRIQVRGTPAEDWQWNGVGANPQWTKVSP